jgi:hypothetical protein
VVTLEEESPGLPAETPTLSATKLAVRVALAVEKYEMWAAKEVPVEHA